MTQANTLPSPQHPPGQPPNNLPRLWAVVPCAGSGSRAGSAQPKQYQAVAGAPLVVHTLRALADVAQICKTLVVVAPGDVFLDQFLPQFASLSIAYGGGETRTKSVFNGLNYLLGLGAAENDWVLVHDAARCLITPALVRQLVDACWQDEVGGLLALPLPDTLKSAAHGRVAATVDRADKWLAQTPQMFRLGPLLYALQACEAAGVAVTDESSAMEAQGLKPLLVPGSAQNFKVTYPEDFALAQSLLQARTMLP
jgi:2-C-methyl-D-erythritol 4-phosphate cytidylyltransferase